MPATHLSSTSRALYRVFVAPNFRATASIPLLYVPALTPKRPSSAITTPHLASHTTIRTLKYARDTRRQAISDYYVIDHAIQANWIKLVDADGTFRGEVPLAKALSSLNKTTHHLVQVSAGKVDEFGNPDPDDLPTCRVMTKIDLRMQHKRKLDALRRQAKGHGTGPAPKLLELNWAIGEWDLQHRLGRMQDFLREGRKVELTLAPKRQGKRATPEEADGVIQAVRNAVAECKGAIEKSATGTVGGVMTIVYEGVKVEKRTGNKAGESEDMEEGNEANSANTEGDVEDTIEDVAEDKSERKARENTDDNRRRRRRRR